MGNHFYTTLGELPLVLLFIITHVRLLRNTNVLNFGTYPIGEQTRQYTYNIAQTMFLKALTETNECEGLVYRQP